MKSAEELIHEGKEQWDKLKTELEEFNVQLALGRNEAKDAFEREWKNFSVFLDEQSLRLRRRSHWADRLMEKLEERTKSLKNAVTQAEPGNLEAYHNWKEQTLRIVYETEFIIDELYPALEPDEKELISAFRIKLELYRSRLNILSPGELATLRPEAEHLAAKADEILSWRDYDTETTREKLDRFGKEIRVSFDHLKEAFGGLVK